MKLGTCGACGASIYGVEVGSFAVKCKPVVAPTHCAGCGAALTSISVVPDPAPDSVTPVENVERLSWVKPITSKDVRDIPARLRDLAAQIERGDFGDVKQLAWVMTDNVPRREPHVGLLGEAHAIGAELHWLLTRGARYVEPER